MKIPAQVKPYKPFGNGQQFTELKRVSTQTYEPKKGELIDVLFWARYPGYDFIFGVPMKGNPYAKHEAAFFQYRDARKKKVRHVFYLDEGELKNFAMGFNLILKHHRKNKTEEQR